MYQALCLLTSPNVTPISKGDGGGIERFTVQGQKERGLEPRLGSRGCALTHNAAGGLEWRKVGGGEMDKLLQPGTQRGWTEAPPSISALHSGAKDGLAGRRAAVGAPRRP